MPKLKNKTRRMLATIIIGLITLVVVRRFMRADNDEDFTNAGGIDIEEEPGGVSETMGLTPDGGSRRQRQQMAMQQNGRARKPNVEPAMENEPTGGNTLGRMQTTLQGFRRGTSSAVNVRSSPGRLAGFGT